MSTVITKSKKVMFCLAFLGVTYNAILAVINSLFFEVSSVLVVFAEITILGTSLAIVIGLSNLVDKDKYVIFLFLSVIFSSLLIFLNTKIIFVDAIRNFLIICVFFLIGGRLSEEYMHKLFLVVSIVVAFFLVLEISVLSAYVEIFKPAVYYQNTRGIEIMEYNQTGVFGNAEGFAERFSYGVFSGPRTSSIFLEQVSLANFCAILGLYILVFQPALKKGVKIFYLCLIILICLSNETRVGSFLVIVLFTIGLFRANVPAYSNLAVFYTTILAVFFINSFYGEATGDNFLGRINLGVEYFLGLGITDYFGHGIFKIDKFWDSGYAYLFAAYTIFGASTFICFTLFILKQISTESRLCALGLSLYVYINVAVGGNSIYSIKTATLLWLIVGYVYYRDVAIKLNEAPESSATQ